MSTYSIRDFRKGLRVLERRVELALIAQTECCGVTPAQCHLLLEVEGASEASVGDLAASLELDASTLSRTVDGLVKAGLLARREDPANRRRQLVCLTLPGRERARFINDNCDRYYGNLLAALPTGKADTLLEVLPLFIDAMSGRRLPGGVGACCSESGTAEK